MIRYKVFGLAYPCGRSNNFMLSNIFGRYKKDERANSSNIMVNESDNTDLYKSIAKNLIYIYVVA